MESKSDAVRRLVKIGAWNDALAIAKSFRLGITKEQHSAIVRAHECSHYPEFYKEVGYDVNDLIQNGCDVLVALYG